MGSTRAWWSYGALLLIVATSTGGAAQGVEGTSQAEAMKWTVVPDRLPGQYEGEFTITSKTQGGLSFPGLRTDVEARALMAGPEVVLEPSTYSIEWGIGETAHTQKVVVKFTLWPSDAFEPVMDLALWTQTNQELYRWKGLGARYAVPIPDSFFDEAISPLSERSGPEGSAGDGEEVDGGPVENAVPSLAPLTAIGLVGAMALVARRRP